MTTPRLHRLAAVLAVSVALTGSARAQAPLSALLLHPESAFIPASPGPAGLDLIVDGQPSLPSTSTILLQKSTPDADFVAAVWSDVSGHKLHQREVFVVKPFYAIVVDHLYAPTGGEHTVVRQIDLPPGATRLDGTAAEVTLPGGKMYRCQPNDRPQDGVRAEWKGSVVTFTTQMALPAPASVVLLAGTSLPTVTYVKPANPMIVKCLVKFPDGREDEVAVSWESRPLHVGGKELKGWAACATRGPAGEKQIEIQP